MLYGVVPFVHAIASVFMKLTISWRKTKKKSLSQLYRHDVIHLPMSHDCSLCRGFPRYPDSAFANNVLL